VIFGIYVLMGDPNDSIIYPILSAMVVHVFSSYIMIASLNGSLPFSSPISKTDEGEQISNMHVHLSVNHCDALADNLITDV
jgi:hypothetical protein